MCASFCYISIHLSGSVTGTSESGAELSRADRAMLEYVRLEAERFGSEGAVAEGSRADTNSDTAIAACVMEAEEHDCSQDGSSNKAIAQVPKLP